MKKIILLIITHFSLLIAVCFSQPSITWQRVYGTATWPEYFYSVVQVPDSGFIAAGAKHGGYILRTNKFGDTLWSKIYPGTAFTLILQIVDNNFVLTGSGILLVKMDINGNILWSKPKYNDWTYTYRITETTDKGFILVGYLDSGIYYYPYMIKVDSLGDFQWSKTFANMPNTDFSDIIYIDSSGYAITGDDFLSSFMMKTDIGGNPLWLKHYDNTTGASSFVRLSDKGFAIAGGNYLLKTDSLGNLKWLKYYEFSSRSAFIRSMINTNDGGFALTGDVDTLGNLNYFMHLIKTDSFGNIQWYKYFGSNNYDIGYCVRQTNDHGYIIAGLKDSSYSITHSYLIKTDSGGFAPPIGIHPISNKIPVSFNLSQNYPNPFNPKTKIKFEIPTPLRPPFNQRGDGAAGGFLVLLTIYDILGREVQTLVNEPLKPGTYEVEFDGSNFASGIYFYRLTTNDFTQTKKMVLVK